MGLNPFFHDTKFILEKLKENEIFKDYKLKIKEIYFYGAGCSSEDRKIILKNALSQFFTFAKRIVVDHDLTAAVLATSQYSPSISCILGTGSNSCLRAFDCTTNQLEVFFRNKNHCPRLQ
jgi:N-acetylglucosamine kinase-like BadF-type ATPase